MFPVIVSLDNSEGFLKPGMNGEVSMLVDRRENVLAVANDAVRTVREASTTAPYLGLNPDTVAAQVREMQAQMGNGRGGAGGRMGQPAVDAPAAQTVDASGAMPAAGGRGGAGGGQGRPKTGADSQAGATSGSGGAGGGGGGDRPRRNRGDSGAQGARGGGGGGRGVRRQQHRPDGWRLRRWHGWQRHGRWRHAAGGGGRGGNRNSGGGGGAAAQHLPRSALAWPAAARVA